MRSKCFLNTIDTIHTVFLEPISKLIFSRARPEPVEGYPRALEENPSTSSGRARRNLVFLDFRDGFLLSPIISVFYHKYEYIDRMETKKAPRF